MPDVGNPYIPGQPVTNPSLFFGRRDATTWIRDNLVKWRRLLLVCGASRVGKTSLLRQLPASLPGAYTPIQVELIDEEFKQLDQLLWRLAEVIAQQLGAQFGVKGLQPAWTDFEGHTEHLLDSFWPQVRAALGERSLILLLDDADSLVRAGLDLLSPLLSVLEAWCARDERLAFILTLTLSPQELAARANIQLPGHLPVYLLGPLTSEEAIRLIGEPVEGVITYDYGVARRLVEITSGQPYYLQLLCFEIFNRCAASGWVNQRDVDAVVEQLVRREIPDFRQIWHDSSPQEQAVLAALVSLRGARGVATALEMHTILINAGARVERQQVAEVLEQIAARGILERLGALSYRFRVTLFSDWLRQRVDLPKLVRSTRWSKDRDRVPVEIEPLAPSAQKVARPPQADTPEAAATAEGAMPARRSLRNRWLWIAPALLAGLALLATLAFLLWRSPGEPLPTATVTLQPATFQPTATRSVAQATATRPTTIPASPSPTPSPTLTPPVIVSRPLPAIAYQSLPSGAKNWAIYIMGSKGDNPLRLTDDQSNAISPAWSPDGAKIAFVSNRDGNSDIWVMPVPGPQGPANSSDGQPLNLTQHPAQDRWPAWSPDGERIAFASVRDGPYWELYLMRADGSDVQRLTWWQDASDIAPAWSPDGNRIAFASRRDGNWEIYAMDRDGGNLIRLTVDPADDSNPAWSPDGSQIAFESTRSGYTDIFVMTADGQEVVNLTKTRFASDHGPTWSPDGGRIAFYSDRGGSWSIYVMAADGSNAVRLTGEGSNDQVPAWRP